MQRIRLYALLGCALLLSGCGDSTGPPTVGSITDLSSNLAGTVGATVSVQVRVSDDLGSPLEGVPVAFTPGSGEGSVSPSSATSNALGTASTTWTLGTTSGSQSLQVRAGGKSISVQAEATPGPPAALSVASGAGQSGSVGDALPVAISIKVEDQFGNGAPGAVVNFVVSLGGGSVSREASISNEAGLADTDWTMGTALGPNGLDVSVVGLAPIQVTANATPGPPSKIALISGDGQSGEVGLQLSQPLVVELRDRFDNLTPGASVTFEGDGAVDLASATANEGGQASVTWILGAVAGPQATVASVGEESVTFSATGVPGPPTSLAVVSGNDQNGFAGGELALSPTVMVSDSFGNGAPGTDVTFQVTGGGGTVGSTSVASDTAGMASTSWTLGTTVGENLLEARVEGVDSAQFTATATSGPPASIAKVSGDAQSAEVGTLLPDPQVVRVEDQFGNPVEGAVLEAVVVSGAGTPDPTTPTTDSLGIAQVTWTLGGAAGSQVLEVRVGSVTPASFTATAVAGPPAAMVKVAGDDQTAVISSTVPLRPSVVVSDSFGNPVSGIGVTFEVAKGGGSVTGANQTSGSDGRATVGSWTLGPTLGQNQLLAHSGDLDSLLFTATAVVASYDIDLRYVGAVPSTAQQGAFTQAANRWESIVTSELVDFYTVVPAGWCADVPHLALDETIDDLLIFIEVIAIDGVNGTLGQAGPCGLHAGGGLPLIGYIQMDVADLDALEASGDLNDVILHEMGHVIGIGATSQWNDIVVDAGTADPYFPGAAAVVAYRGAGGAAVNAVPVANTGGEGTRDSHWREADMGRELMTGFLNLGVLNPLSLITVRALQDLGYSVDGGAADGYSVGPGLRADRGGRLFRLNELPSPPPRPVPRAPFRR